MKKDLHPDNYRIVVFEDLNDGTQFLTKSTAPAEDTIKWEDGNEYPLIKVHISSASHPFYTGTEKLVDVEGRVDRFKARTEAAKKKKEELTNKAKKQAAAKESKKEEETTKIGGGQTKKSHKPKKNNQKPKQDKPQEKPKAPEAKKAEEPKDK